MRFSLDCGVTNFMPLQKQITIFRGALKLFKQAVQTL
jgi:hypothetical protein